MSLSRRFGPTRAALTSLAACLTVALWAPGQAQATITRYTSPAAFLAAAGSVGTDSFQDLSTGTTLATPVARSAGGLAYQLTGASLRGFDRGGDLWLMSDAGSGWVGLANFAQPVYALGAWFQLTDAAGTVTTSIGNASVEDINGLSSALNVFNATGPYFVGFVSTVPLRSALFSSSSFDRAMLNDVMLGAGTSPIPEPTRALLLLAGLAAVGWVALPRPEPRA